MKRLHYGWLMVVISAVILAIIAARFYTFGIFLLPLSDDFAWSRGSISLASSAASVFGGILSIFVAKLSDKYGPRLFVTIAGVLHTAGFLLASQITELWQLYLIWGLIMGTGNACGYVPLMSTIARWFSIRRTTAIGITIAGFATGAIAWPLVTQWLISTLNWQQAFIILGIISAIGIIPLAQFLRTSPESMGLQSYGQDHPDHKQMPLSVNKGLTLSQTIKTVRFWLWGPIIFCFFTSLNILYVHIVAYARDTDIPPMIAASTLSIIAGSSIIARLTIGTISDKIGTIKALIGAMVLAVVAFTFLVTSPGLWAFYIFAVIFGLAYGSVVPLETAVPAGLFGITSLGAIMATAGLFPMVGAAFGPPIAGVIFDKTGKYQSAFIICLSLVILAFILSIFLYRSQQKKLSSS
jgi:MFS family permease